MIDQRAAALASGAAFYQAGRFPDAEKVARQVLAAEPQSVAAWALLASVLLALGRREEALACHDAALVIAPHFDAGHRERARVLYLMGRDLDGLRSVENAIRLNPGCAPSHTCRGEILAALGRAADALVSFDHALRADPALAAAHRGRADVLRFLGRTAEALAAAGEAVRLQTRQPESLISRALALQAMGRDEESLRDLQQAVTIDPGYAIGYWYAALCLRRLGRLEEALRCWDRTQQLQPRSAGTLVNRGLVNYELGRFEAALRDYHAAIQLEPANPDAYWNASWCLLKLGRFREGWPQFEWRHRLSGASRPLPGPLWCQTGDWHGRTVVLRTEQGLGDIIQFCRYVPLVAATGARVVLEVPAELVDLLGTLAGVERVVRRGDPLPHYDTQSSLMSLPLAFQTDLSNLPAQVAYLRADPQQVEIWRQRIGPGAKLRVGLTWSAGSRPNQPQLWSYAKRNLPFPLLAQLKGIDAEFHSLQKGQPAESLLGQAEADGWDGPPIIDWAAELRDFADTAALMECLDLVISVDTAVAHLAGALGKPVWILLSQDACWRWFLERSDSPWYPTAMLYRQEAMGDWQGVIARVGADLAALAAQQ